MLQRLPLRALPRPYLRQIDLVREMPVRHAVLVPIGHVPRADATARRWIDEVGEVACVFRLEVDADAPVEVRTGGVHVQVGDADLDNAGEFLAGFHVGAYADAGFVFRVVELLTDDRGEAVDGLVGNVVEAVDFFFVDVEDFDAGGLLGVSDRVVQVVVEVLVLVLGEEVKDGREGWTRRLPGGGV